MKALIAALLVAVVAVAADESCPSDWWAHDKLLAHEDCHKFYMCSYGKPVEMTCCCDLYFNIKTGQCDWQYNVDCGDRNSPGEDSTRILELETDPTTPESTATDPTTAESTTLEPTTTEPATSEATTPEPTTTESATSEPTTPEPTTTEPATSEPITTEPTTPEPTTTGPTSPESTTTEPTFTEPTTPTPTTVKPTTPAPGFLENGCPVDPHIHWLLPVEGDCNGFYYCVWGELVLRACPPTLHFNKELQVCDWPAKAGCNSPVPTTTVPPEPNATTPTTSNDTTVKPTTPTSGFLENGCPTNPHIHWLLPVEGDCNGFYYCVWGELVLRACPPTLHFNKDLQVCDWPANAGCNSSEPPTETEPTTPEPTTTETTTPQPTTPAPTTTQPTTPEPTTAKPTTPAPGWLENGCPVDPHIHWLLPVEGDCNGFYYCVWGELVLRACPPILHFNKVLQVCDWPANAGCNSSVPTTAKPTTPEANATTPTTPIPTTDKPTTPTSEFLENGCPTNPHIHWLLPVEGDCNGFYYCVWGELVLRACPPALHFNKDLQVCDWPENAGCNFSEPPSETEPTTPEPTTVEPTTPEPTITEPTTSEPTTPEPTTTEPITSEPTTPEPTATETITPEPTITEPTTPVPTTVTPATPAPGWLENGCPVDPHIHWLLPVEGDCNGFYYCVWGELVLRACPPTLHFNKDLQVCDWPTNAGCNSSVPTTTQPTTPKPSVTTPTTPKDTTAKPTTPTSGFLENGCPTNPHIHWLLPVEGDCNGFYYCVWGELVLRACPPTLHFNKELQVCDWPANAGCNSSVPTTAKPTTQTPNATTPTTPTPTTAKPTTPTSGFLENGCPTNPHIHWLLPVEGDCNGFYYCVWGELVLRACPPTLHFNKDLQVCDWPANAGCNSSVPTTTQPTTSEPNATTPTTPEPTTVEPTTPAAGFLANGCPVDPHIHWLLPVEGDCNGFYYCVWGELVLRACPPTLHFNRRIQVCDWPTDAGCITSLNKHNMGQYSKLFATELFKGITNSRI